MKPRPGTDIVKLVDLDPATALHRLRVGKRRACYAVTSADREVLILLFEDREVGYKRMMDSAKRRLTSRRP